MKTVAEFIQRKQQYSWNKVYSLDEQGVWQIYGEDPNCDFGGHHHEPYLETVEGTYQQAIERALTLPRFFTWGAGGDVKKIEVKKL